MESDFSKETPGKETGDILDGGQQVAETGGTQRAVPTKRAKQCRGGMKSHKTNLTSHIFVIH